MASTTAQRRSASTRPQDPAIADVTQGVTGLGTTKSEDQRREEGTDASQADGAGDHDYSPEATSGQAPGGAVLDTYTGGAQSTHDNIAGPSQELVLGQAPQTPTNPMKGSRAYGEKFHPSVPNAMNRSPIVVGVDKDPRNDPKHPGFAQADRAHPDYGLPAEQHQGTRAQAPSYEDIKRKAIQDEGEQSADPEELEAEKDTATT